MPEELVLLIRCPDREGLVASVTDGHHSFLPAFASGQPYHAAHARGVDDMVRKCRDLEEFVLARAVYAQIGHRVLVRDNRTVVFD